MNKNQKRITSLFNIAHWNAIPLQSLSERSHSGVEVDWHI